MRSDGAGKGSEFIVRLPLAAPPLQRLASPKPSEPKAAALHILIVDDNVDSAESLAILMRMSGHQVQTAYIGSTALQAASSFGPHVILLDIGLPGMDGYEVARRLRAEPQTAKVALIAMTGYGNAADQRDAAVAGFDSHLVKPVDLDELQRLLVAQIH